MNTMNTNSAALIRCCEYYVMNAVPGMNTIIKPVEYAHRPRHTDPPGPAQPGPRVRAAKTARWRATAWHCESTMDTDTRMRTCL